MNYSKPRRRGQWLHPGESRIERILIHHPGYRLLLRPSLGFLVTPTQLRRDPLLALPSRRERDNVMTAAPSVPLGFRLPRQGGFRCGHGDGLLNWRWRGSGWRSWHLGLS